MDFKYKNKTIRNIAVFVFIFIFVIPMIVEAFMLSGLFDGATGKGSDWLGFWGGYLGAIVSIGGVYWSLRLQFEHDNKNLQKQIKENQKEFKTQLNENHRIERYGARPDFIVQYDVFNVNAIQDWNYLYINNYDEIQTEDFIKKHSIGTLLSINAVSGFKESLPTYVKAIKITNQSDRAILNVKVTISISNDYKNKDETIEIPLIPANDFAFYIPRFFINQSGWEIQTMNFWVKTRYERLYYQYDHFQTTNVWEIRTGNPSSDQEVKPGWIPGWLEFEPDTFERITNISEKNI
ncbi:hypothetical protein OXT66_05710 [Lentilactobacillus senioris]|uniref:hypothetical protein n=1 Tax=Lentilactobacillus senioris TaxID=931534 RepID=UPI0022818E3F|nr:hypothetical protein [Lentilactobacillus senioris]MCY9807046.1 hypothetical protein [Lentilactobacillus senioris]